MSKEDFIKFKGTVTDKFPAGRFTVVVENGHKIDAFVNGKIRKHNISIYVGDTVDVEVSPYDLSKGRITYRY